MLNPRADLLEAVDQLRLLFGWMGRVNTKKYPNCAACTVLLGLRDHDFVADPFVR